MTTRPTRRGFLKSSAAGLAGAALPASRSAAAPAAGVPDATERRRLVRLAHFGKKTPAAGAGGMAITSHPLATREAVEVLRRGGNACDAALAASITQTVVEPHMTTITGCLSQLYHDRASGETTYVNGNVNTPMAPLPGFGVHDLATGRGGGGAGLVGRLRGGPRPPRLAAAEGPDGDGHRLRPRGLRDAPVPLGRGLRAVREDRAHRRRTGDLLRRQRDPPPGRGALPEARRRHPGAAGRGGGRLLLPGRLRPPGLGGGPVGRRGAHPG